MTMMKSSPLASTRPGPPPIAERIATLQAEARRLAREHVDAMTDAMETLRALASEIEGGGDAYSVGVREVARQVAEDMCIKGQTLAAVEARA